MRRRRYRRESRRNLPFICLAGALAFVLICLLSAKFLFFILAVVLIALGLYMLSCA
ncbi:MAG: hypothetical protein FWG70_02090 [Oscillospiraceae bacterium]|nr:hypothetical protein [Oscillospiraceae bacterium]